MSLSILRNQLYSYPNSNRELVWEFLASYKKHIAELSPEKLPVAALDIAADISGALLRQEWVDPETEPVLSEIEELALALEDEYRPSQWERMIALIDEGIK